ncbi:MAG: leucyl aminopeptidase [Actinomycetota bacterium]|nr:leucyl aminopeptidase [Actinomycetota bacterium]
MAAIDVVVTDSRPGGLDLLAAPVLDPAPPLGGEIARLDDELGGRLTQLAQDGEVVGRFNTAAVVHVDAAVGAPRVAAAGLGSLERLDADSFRTAGAAVVRRARDFARAIGWLLDETLPLPVEEQARALVEGTVLGVYDPGLWKTRDGDRGGIDRVVLITERTDAVRPIAERAARVGGWTNRARDLSNMPPNELTPQRLAARAEEIADEQENVRAAALGPDEIGDLGMGAFAAVAQGSHNPARLIVMRYDPPGAREDVFLGLVGKAITFDTGGISIKPALYMEDMKGDMSGGGAVVEATGALADLGVPLRVISVVAATENMPGGGSYRPGDILRAMNGKTIEVINTDAEGRLVLADALAYARDEGATHLLDLATLTGAMQLALGDLYAGVYANDDGWRELVVDAGEASGDHAWPFPLHPRYRRYVDSVYADMKNATVIREASPTLAAAFLQEFVGEGPWAHIDIAGPAFFRYDRGDYLSQKGGTGYGVRLIVELAQRLAGEPPR